MYTMPKNLLSICVNFALATQRLLRLTYFALDMDGLTMVYFKQLMVVNLSERAR